MGYYQKLIKLKKNHFKASKLSRLYFIALIKKKIFFPLRRLWYDISTTYNDVYKIFPLFSDW